MQEHRRLFMVEGVLLIVLGLLAVILPMVTALTVNVVIALALTVAGISRLVTWRGNKLDGLWRLLVGGLLTGVGIYMLVLPEQGIAALVMVLGFILLLEGTFGILASITLQRRSHAIWLFISGLVSLALGALVLMFFPEAGVLYLAFIIGLSLILTGVSLLTMLRDSANGHP